ncbi:hypothetical protein Tco_0840549 [Tanacetum coccineum]|uniref:Reverse transcriptase Ty1/copia-type domain-containing protein n=1 Tax=Tanacetum coccineum TaxID=301880 RepID=A0ABQ5AWV6_9ASTR
MEFFISQDKYVTEILKKFCFTDVKTASTHMETQKNLLKDEDSEEVDVHLYRSMISSLMYLTSSRPDIMFAVCACARYQVNLKVSHLHAVKKIFRYLKGQPKLGLWYPKYSSFDLVAYTDSDYARVSLDRKSTTRVDGKKIIVTKASVRRNLQLNDEEGTDCLPNATIFEELTRMSAKTIAWNEFSSTMASAIICLATNQKFNFSKYIFESMVKNLDNAGKFLMYPRFVQVFLEKQLEDKAVNEEMDDSLGTSSGSGPRRQETMGDTIAQTGFENVSKISNDALLAGVNTPQSDEERLKLNELMEFCTKLQQRVLDLENTKTAQAQEITKVVPDKEEVAIDVIPLATKPLSIVDWKIHKEGKKSYYKIYRADGSSKMYLVFSHMLKSLNREDLETLYKLVKAKYGSTRPVEDLDLVLYRDLKTMF